jgi:cardiolipin synthase
MGGALTKRPLLCGNRIDPLVGSNEAYPAMLEAIESAQFSISLGTYIFNNDDTGRKFVAALGAAVERGVEVRVLIDAIGLRYTWPSILAPLKKAGVPVARFLPALVPIWFPYSNLRNHRKILVVDGRTGFTGGMNIRQSTATDSQGEPSIQDLHFRLTGPVVRHLQQVFADDWEFTTRKSLDGDTWFPALEPQGPILARGISDGPDEDLDKLRLTLLGAIACAQSSVQIVTPYFLPDSALITSLNVASMRGVQVDILLPAVNNLTAVQWASTALWWQLLEYGCRIWLTPPPFEHTKLMLVDRHWSLVGSGNWDPRSLRLNFEFNVECYDQQLAARLGALVDDKLARSRSVTLADVDGRKLPIKLRDGVARLFSPYL